MFPSRRGTSSRVRLRAGEGLQHVEVQRLLLMETASQEALAQANEKAMLVKKENEKEKLST